MDTRWTFLTNHGAVFLRLIDHPGDTIRQIFGHLDVAACTIIGIVTDLRRAGYLSAATAGRHHVDTVQANAPMRHPSWASQTVNAFFGILRSRKIQQKMRS